MQKNLIIRGTSIDKIFIRDQIQCEIVYVYVFTFKLLHQQEKNVNTNCKYLRSIYEL